MDLKSFQVMGHSDWAKLYVCNFVLDLDFVLFLFFLGFIILNTKMGGEKMGYYSCASLLIVM